MDNDERYTRITLRIPRELDAALNEASSKSSKSKNAEIIARLEHTFAPQTLAELMPEEALLAQMRGYLDEVHRLRGILRDRGALPNQE